MKQMIKKLSAVLFLPQLKLLRLFLLFLTHSESICLDENKDKKFKILKPIDRFENYHILNKNIIMKFARIKTL